MNSVNVRAVDISAAYLGIVDTPFYSLRAEKVLNAFNDSTVQRKLNVEYSWTFNSPTSSTTAGSPSWIGF